MDYFDLKTKTERVFKRTKIKRIIVDQTNNLWIKSLLNLNPMVKWIS